MDVNALTSEVGEMLNTYFVDPVSRTVGSLMYNQEPN
jgi:uncharacterized protein (DUF2164 family)